MQPILWILASVLAAFVSASMSGKAPEWALIVLGAMSFLALLVAVVVYCCFALKNPDLLRTEKFLIRRMEIEQSAIGDSLKGVVSGPQANGPILPDSSEKAP